MPPHADADTIQSAYHQKMKQCHPDRVAGLAPEFGELAERQAKRLNAAYRNAIQGHRGQEEQAAALQGQVQINASP